MYIMAPEPIATAHSINPTHQFMCLYVCIPPIVTRQSLCKNPPIVARQRSGKSVTAATNTQQWKNYWTHVSGGLWIPLSLLGNN
jgi:hypothetical protein